MRYKEMRDNLAWHFFPLTIDLEKTMDFKRYRTRTSEMWLDKENIIHVDLFQNVNMSLEDARENYNTVIKISEGESYPLLIDGRTMVSMERGARVYFSEVDNVMAAALVVGTPLSRIIGNFFIGLNRASIAFRLFSSKTEAFEWLKGYLP